MDQLTSSGERSSFARACVNIQAESSFPESFFITSEGESVEIRMEYQGVPTMCSHCCVFGHETKICLSARVSKLSETQVSTADNPSKGDGWTTIKDKGKRKVGEPRLAISPVLPVKISSSSAEGGTEMRTVTAEDFSNKATAQVEIVLSAALDIAKLSHPGAGEIFQGVEKAAVLGELSTVVPFSHMERTNATGSSTKNKSSGKSGSQKKKKKR
ncbi:hypothetical protein CsSME_00004772 [Camellia sinensis var. sinensis]